MEKSNEELLKMDLEEKKHTFISTGLSTMDDIEKAVNIFKDNDLVTLLIGVNNQ